MKRNNKNKYGFPILCCDPSLTAFGWSIIRNNELLASGCIKTQPTDKKLRIRKGDDRVRRIQEIASELLYQIKKYRVCYIVSEQPHGSQSSASAIMVGISLALLQSLSVALEIGIEWYSESDCKKVVLGKSTAEKKEMITAIDRRIEVPWTGTKYKDEAVADSIAVFYAAKEFSSTIKFMLR